jgi:hypothetical protein
MPPNWPRHTCRVRTKALVRGGGVRTCLPNCVLSLRPNDVRDQKASSKPGSLTSGHPSP